MDFLKGTNDKASTQSSSGSGGGLMDTLHGAVGGGRNSEKNEGTFRSVVLDQANLTTVSRYA